MATSNKHIYIRYFSSPIGDLIIGSFNDQLCLCDWLYRKKRKEIDLRLQKFFNASYIEEQTSIHTETIAQLNAYFNKELNQFDLPLLFAGTTFQIQVWNKLQEIPYGTTQSYLQLAKSMGDEKTIRAVATANGANAISIIVPCHRIIGTDGSLVGYAGGLEAKRKLLLLENVRNESEQLSFF